MVLPPRRVSFADQRHQTRPIFKVTALLIGRIMRPLSRTVATAYRDRADASSFAETFMMSYETRFQLLGPGLAYCGDQFPCYNVAFRCSSRVKPFREHIRLSRITF